MAIILPILKLLYWIKRYKIECTNTHAQYFGKYTYLRAHLVKKVSLGPENHRARSRVTKRGTCPNAFKLILIDEVIEFRNNNFAE